MRVLGGGGARTWIFICHVKETINGDALFTIPPPEHMSDDYRRICMRSKDDARIKCSFVYNPKWTPFHPLTPKSFRWVNCSQGKIKSRDVAQFITTGWSEPFGAEENTQGQTSNKEQTHFLYLWHWKWLWEHNRYLLAFSKKKISCTRVLLRGFIPRWNLARGQLRVSLKCEVKAGARLCDTGEHTEEINVVAPLLHFAAPSTLFKTNINSCQSK